MMDDKTFLIAVRAWGVEDEVHIIIKSEGKPRDRGAL